MMNLDDKRHVKNDPCLIKFWIEGKLKNCSKRECQTKVSRRKKPNIKPKNVSKNGNKKLN